MQSVFDAQPDVTPARNPARAQHCWSEPVVAVFEVHGDAWAQKLFKRIVEFTLRPSGLEIASRIGKSSSFFGLASSVTSGSINSRLPTRPCASALAAVSRKTMATHNPTSIIRTGFSILPSLGNHNHANSYIQVPTDLPQIPRSWMQQDRGQTCLWLEVTGQPADTDEAAP